jgi:argininosuccinate lyase
VELCLPVFTAMLDTLALREKNMRKAASGGFINATDCADYLVKKGIPFRDAYMIVGRLVNMCIQTGKIWRPDAPRISAPFRAPLTRTFTKHWSSDLRQ